MANYIAYSLHTALGMLLLICADRIANKCTRQTVWFVRVAVVAMYTGGFGIVAAPFFSAQTEVPDLIALFGAAIYLAADRRIDPLPPTEHEQ